MKYDIISVLSLVTARSNAFVLLLLPHPLLSLPCPLIFFFIQHMYKQERHGSASMITVSQKPLLKRRSRSLRTGVHRSVLSISAKISLKTHSLHYSQLHLDYRHLHSIHHLLLVLLTFLRLSECFRPMLFLGVVILYQLTVNSLH